MSKAIETPSPYGNCRLCGTPLTNAGAASHGDGDLFDEIRCDECNMLVAEFHTSYCACDDCREGMSKWHSVEEEPDPYFAPY